MCTRDLCFEAKIRKKYHNFTSENYLFYNREKLLYITSACFRNEENNFVSCTVSRMTLKKYVFLSHFLLNISNMTIY